MSLINQVLQDLEARRGGIEGRRLPDEVRALPPQRRRAAWPWLLAAAACVGIGLAAVYLLPPATLPPAAVEPPHPVVIPEPVVAVAVPPPTAPLPAPAAGKTAAPAAREPLVPPGAATPVVVAKEVRAPTPRERANAEYAKALAALNQGRTEPAASGLRAALAEDPTWAAPRQALLALLLEQRRFDEAEVLLRQGMAQNPQQVDLAVQLARLQVERKDFPAALETLRQAAPQAAGNADYLGLDAAVLQRLGRHREAAAAYAAGLRLAPQNGVWWMGLGISLEADGRIEEAGEAYRRARDSGALNPASLNFVEQKLKSGRDGK